MPTKFGKVIEELKNDPNLNWLAPPLETSYENLSEYWPENKINYLADKQWLPRFIEILAKYRKKIYMPDGDGWKELIDYMKDEDVNVGVNDVVDAGNKDRLLDYIFASVSVDYEYNTHEGSDFMKKIRQRLRSTADFGLSMEVFDITERNFLNRSGFTKEDYISQQQTNMVELVASQDTGFEIREQKIFDKLGNEIKLAEFKELVGNKIIKDKIRKGESEKFFQDSWDVAEATDQNIFDAAILVADKGVVAVKEVIKVIKYKEYIPAQEEQYFQDIVAKGGSINIREVHEKTRAMPRLQWSKNEINELIKIKFSDEMKGKSNKELATAFIEKTGSVRKHTSVEPWISRNQNKLKQQQKL